jgi:hypothetical protein
MKKILLIVLLIPLLFTTCKKEEDNTFSGSWTGTYSGDDYGIWAATISSTGNINGSATNSLGDNQTLSGSVTTNGSFSATVGTGTLGSNFVGQFSGNSGSGTWSNSSVGFTGTWEGDKQ